MGKLQGSSWDSIFTFSHGMEFFILPKRSVSKIVFLNFVWALIYMKIIPSENVTQCLDPFEN